MARKIITICSSADFYKHVNELADELGKKGYKVLVPATATKMKTSGIYEVSHYKTWYDSEDDFNKKANLMRVHFDKVAKADAILVVNDEKHGVAGYIGPNALIEIGLAFYLNKPIFVLNPVFRESPVYEELMGMGSIILDGDLAKIKL